MAVTELTVGEYLNELAASSAVPGGGSAAAIAGAMGASLLSMVVKVSLKKSVEGQRELQDAAPALERIARRLGTLGQEDVDAYKAVLTIRKEPAAAPRRSERLAAAIERAARVPLETATLAGEAIDLAERLTPFAWKAVSSDLETARHLLVTAFEGGLANVAINLADLDGAARAQVEAAYRELGSRRPGRKAPRA